MMPKRVVIDTNILISALLFESRSLAWLLELWQSNVILPLISRDTAAEFYRVLLYDKFGLSDDVRERYVADYIPWCETVTIPVNIETPECRDPSDIPFLELALAGRADALVTGDHDLLALAPAFAVPIITPGELRELTADRTP